MRVPLRNFVSITGMRIFTAILSFLFFVLLTRYWDRSTLGAFTTIWALSLLLQQISLLGLHIPASRDMVQRPHDLSRLALALTGIGVVVATLIGIVLGVVGSRMYPDSMHVALWLVGASFIATAITGVSETILIAQERLHISAIVNAGEALFRTVLSVVLVHAGYGLTAVFGVYLASRILSAVAYLGPGGVATQLRPTDRSWATVRSLLHLVPTFAAIIILQSGFTRIDFVILSKLGTLADVGMYSAPYKLYEAALTVPAIATVVLFPMLARWFATSPPRFEHFTREVIRWSLTLGLPSAIVLALVARPLLVGLFGPSFGPATAVLVLLAVVPVAAAVDITLAGVLHSSHHQNRDLRAIGASFLFYVIALLALIPTFGIVGAAAATAAAELVQTAIRYVLVRRVVHLQSMLGLIARPIGAALIMVAVVVASRDFPLHVSALSGLLTYAAALAAFGAVTLGDLRDLRSAFIPRKQFT